MAKFEVKIETITVSAHPKADRLELATVGLYRIVVAKGQWKTGDKCFYIPEYSVLEDTLINKLGLEGKLSGPNKNRVNPIRLMGELSQGIVAPLDFVDPKVRENKGEDGDYAPDLGVTKWEPEIPKELQGEAESDTELIKWFDIENLKKFPNKFADGELVMLTEKIHGVCTCFTVINPTEDTAELLVTSKGLSMKNLVLKDTEDSVYWKSARKYNLKRFGRFISEELDETGITKVAIFGETYGTVQDLSYGLNTPTGFVVFDIYIETTDGTSRWLNPEEVVDLTKKFGIPHPPVLYVGGYSLETVKNLASGKEQVSGREVHIREGVVIRPLTRDLATSTDKIAKYVSDSYLTRKNGTEYN